VTYPIQKKIEFIEVDFIPSSSRVGYGLEKFRELINEVTWKVLHNGSFRSKAKNLEERTCIYHV